MTSSSKKQVIVSGVFVLLLCAFLWDFRPYGVRALDLISISIAGVFCLFNFKKWKEFSIVDYIFISVFFLYSVMGYINYHHISSLFILVFAILFVFLRREIDKSLVMKIMKILMVISLATFFLQFALFHSFEIVLDFQTLFGSESRFVYNHLFRPVGLYSEPHTYCVSILLLIIMTLGRQSFEKLHYICCFTLILSMSLWGVVAGLALPLMIVIWNTKTFKKAIVKYILVTASMSISFVFIYDVVLDQKEAVELIEYRITSIFTDKSYKERFTSHVPADPNVKTKNRSKSMKKLPPPKETLLLNSLIGHGLSTYPFTNGLALNGFAFLWHAFGALGIALFVFSTALFWRCHLKLRFFEKLSLFGALLLLLTSYPMVTYAFFWVFISLVPNKNMLCEKFDS